MGGATAAARGAFSEVSETEELFISPRHPYTEALLSSVPKTDPSQRRQRIVLHGEVADPSNPPSGCYFHPRCKYAKEVCRKEEPMLKEIPVSDGSAEGAAAGNGEPHLAACHFAGELSYE